ncbi:MAG: hypothetical protein KGN84_23075, partial [Acidobacteriota bacterium]|nr:hypothetical protein [Acidobacteriota bacterium]
MVKFCTAILAFSAVPCLFAQNPSAPKAPAAPSAPPAVASPAPADPNKVILTIGSVKYTEADYDR